MEKMKESFVGRIVEIALHNFVVKIILHAVAAVLCLGVLIASAVTVSLVNDIYPNGSVGYGSVGIWLLLVAIVGIIMQVLMAIGFVLHHTENAKVQVLVFIASTIKSRFLLFLLINFISCIILALALFSGGAASASYAANIREVSGCDECDDIKQLRNTQAASSAMSFFGVVTIGVLIVILLMNYLEKRRESAADSSNA